MPRNVDETNQVKRAPESNRKPARAREQDGQERLLPPRDAARLLSLSDSWLAKARMRGDGPPFLKLGRSVRYRESALVRWANSRVRWSTSQP